MNILLKNRAPLATITAGNENPNYPAVNVASPILKQRFQSLANSDTVTLDLGANTAIDCVFLGWTNADSVTITVRNAANSVVHTVTRAISRPSADPLVPYEVQYGVVESFYFTEIQGAKLQVALSASAPVFVGGVGFGLMDQTPDVSASWDKGFDDNSIVSESDGGQTLQNYVRPLQQFTFDMPNMNAEEREYWALAYSNVGRGRNVWVDFFPGDHDYQAPLWCTIASVLDLKKSGHRYTMKLKFKEAR